MKIRPQLTRRRMLTLAALPTAAVCGWGLRELAENRVTKIDGFDDDGPARPVPETPEIMRLRRFAQALEPLYSKMPPPQPDEWLAKHVEFGETFTQFLSGNSEKLCDRFAKIRLVPIGDLFDSLEQLCVDAADYLPRFFGFPVERLEPASLDDLPAQAQRLRESGARQVLTAYLLNEVLLPRRDDDTAAVVGITASDLWDADFSFLFGQASRTQRISVCSMARFGDPDTAETEYATCLRRTVGVLSHETGHAFGLPHCIAYLCRMTGSNHLEESDRRPLDFCPECLPKIWWTCGIDPHERYGELSEFADRHRLVPDGMLWRTAAARLAAVSSMHRAARSVDR